jgi:hypothetical protein
MTVAWWRGLSHRIRKLEQPVPPLIVPTEQRRLEAWPRPIPDGSDFERVILDRHHRPRAPARRRQKRGCSSANRCSSGNRKIARGNCAMELNRRRWVNQLTRSSIACSAALVRDFPYGLVLPSHPTLWPVARHITALPSQVKAGRTTSTMMGDKQSLRLLLYDLGSTPTGRVKSWPMKISIWTGARRRIRLRTTPFFLRAIL